MRKNALIGGLIAPVLCLLVSQASFAQAGVGVAKIGIDVPAVVQRSELMGRADPKQTLHVSVSLPYADAAGMQSFVDSVSDPKSVNYRNFITPEEVGARFGLPLADVQNVAAYLTSQGFKITLVGKNRLSILAECTVAQAESAFHTTINNYQTLSPKEPGNLSYFSFSKPLQVPASIAPQVLDVEGLESFTRPQPRTTLNPNQTRVLYNTAPIYNGGMHGEGRNLAISNWDGYRLSNVPLYYAQYGLPTPPGGVGSNIHVVTISGGSGSGVPGAEGDLDIQMVLGMAPLSNFYIYDGGNSDLIGVLTREVNDNIADVISESYGWSLPSSTATSAHNLHLSMSAQGITYMAASGDSGTSLEPYSYPDYEPEVLSVGGTSASVDSSGNRLSEVGWNSGGGGWSNNTATFNILPSWQAGNGVPTNINHRLVPDIGLHASGTQNSTAGAYFFYLNGSLTGGYIGTSFASPVFDGALGVAEQSIIAQGGLPPNGAGKQRFGRIQNVFYAQNGRSDVWLDITSGANGTLPNGTSSTAHAGWDFVSGWGAINFNAFVATQVSSNPDFTISATPASQTVVQGNGTSYTVNTTALNSYAGTVTFSVTGLPAGASGSFSPGSVVGSGSSTLSITTASTTAPGTYTLTIIGSDGTLSHSTTVTLVVTSVNAPDFTISASPATQTVTRGNSANYTVTIGAVNGFGGTVSFSATGAPSSVSFSPSTVTGSGNTTMTARTRRGSRGTYTITITGSSGGLTHSTTVTLVVQ